MQGRTSKALKPPSRPELDGLLHAEAVLRQAAAHVDQRRAAVGRAARAGRLYWAKRSIRRSKSMSILQLHSIRCLRNPRSRQILLTCSKSP